MSLYKVLVILLIVTYLQPKCITQRYTKELNCVSLVHKSDLFVVVLPPLLLYSQDILVFEGKVSSDTTQNSAHAVCRDGEIPPGPNVRLYKFNGTFHLTAVSLCPIKVQKWQGMRNTGKTKLNRVV